MAVEANMKYAGTVEHGSRMITSQVKGTLGFEIPLSCADGEITHTLWITSSTRDKVVKTFDEVLGVSLAQLQDEHFVATKLSDAIAGRPVEFTTIDKEYNGNYSVQVQWLNKPSAGGVTSGYDAAKLAASFFGGKSTPKPAPALDFPPQPQRQISDDNIPF